MAPGGCRPYVAMRARTRLFRRQVNKLLHQALPEQRGEWAQVGNDAASNEHIADEIDLRHTEGQRSIPAGATSAVYGWWSATHLQLRKTSLCSRPSSFLATQTADEGLCKHTISGEIL